MTDHIVALEADNFMRLKCVRIKPDRTLVEITGPNAAGKSAVLNAIEAALGGQRAAPEKPVRDGALKARIVLETDRLLVRREFQVGGQSRLAVYAKSEARGEKPQQLRNPQEVLNALFERRAFDPMAFVRANAREQRAMLIEATGLGEALAEIERDWQVAYDKRTAYGRDERALQVRVDAMPLPPDDTPDEPVDTEKVLAELAEARTRVAANDRLRQDTASTRGELSKAKERIAELQSEIMWLQQYVAKWTDRFDKADERNHNLVDPDIDAIERQLADAGRINQNVERARQRTEAEHDLANLRQKLIGCKARLATCDRRRDEAVAGAKLPAGLVFTVDGVLFDGQPVSQASQAEQCRIGVAVVMSHDKGLRIAFVRDGSLLDSKSMRTLHDEVRRQGGQIFIERVAEEAGVGVYLEDGEVVSVAQAVGLPDEDYGVDRADDIADAPVPQ